MPRLKDLHRLKVYHAIAHAWDEPILLACSGGVDSTALLLLATRAERANSVGPFVVVHVNHLTRPETRTEQHQVAALCRDLRVPFVGATVDRKPDEISGSREAVMRTLRYEALGRVGSRLGMERVVTAHTLDDQVETVLMRLMSGSSSVAAAGIEAETQMETKSKVLTILRPLLKTGRQELDEVLAQAGIEAIEDPSNEDESYRRNALRHTVIPALHAVDPGFRSALLRSVEHSARDARVVDALADACYYEMVKFDGESRAIERWRLNEMEPAVSTRILRRAILEFRPHLGRELTFERVEAVRIAAEKSPSGSVIELPEELEVRISRKLIEIQECT